MTPLNIGDKIKVFTQVGLMKEPRWVCGVFLDHVPDDKAMVEVAGNKILSDIRKVKKHVRLAYVNGVCPELEKFATEHWPKLKAITVKAYERVIGRDPSELIIDDNEKTIHDKTENIFIGPAVVERETFLEFRENPCWGVGMIVCDHGTRWEPPSADEIEVGNNMNWANAANLFIDTLWKETHRDFWDDEAMKHDIIQEQEAEAKF
jgi:hypothetical protein